MLLKLAWRNIWRNKRRTLITAASIMFAVLFSSFMESLQKGAWGNMINNMVNYYYGYVQVHQKGFWEDQSIDNSFELQAELKSLPEQIPNLEAVVPRLESFALASSGDQTKGVLVVGIDPEPEDRLTHLKNRVSTGTYLASNSNGILVAEGVAEYLNLNIGDTLVLISQGYHGVNAANKFPVLGTVNFGSPQLNQQMVYLPLAEAQWFYGASNLINSLAFKIEEVKEVPEVLQLAREKIDTAHYEVMDWNQMLPELLEAQELDSAGNIIVYLILYLIISFGIFGTILMMVKERTYEFGVMTAIGMRRNHLGMSVWLETTLLGLIGSLAGILISIPIVWYFHVNPIQLSGDYAGTLEKFGFEPVFPAMFDVTIFGMQAFYVFMITAIWGLYPVLKLRKMQPVKAMRT